MRELEKFTDVFKEVNSIQWAGILGIIGALGMVISDMLLFSAPVSGREFFAADDLGLGYVVDPTSWRFAAAARLSLLMPLYLAGIWQIYQALKPADWRFPLPVLLLFSYAVIMQMVVRVCQLFIGLGQNTGATLADGNEALIALTTSLHTYLDSIEYMTTTIFVAACIWFVVTVATQRTLLPQWSALLTPVLPAAVIDMVARLLPAPLGGFIAPTSYNLAFLILFLATTVLIWPKSGDRSFVDSLTSQRVDRRF